ncbi:MAG: hypothetical protein K8T10_14890 [Candidatus Eremiobacteraeota bacterium]|nr:hypothetical protein [Candidatus Eremiobacteraeota bacterium]
MDNIIQSPKTSLLPEIWRDKPEFVYEYLKRKPYYERLCLEVAFVIENALRERNIEYSAVTHRVKELDSFIEKLKRKQYKDIFNEITDLAGIRVICLYTSDIKKIERIIHEEFNLIEKVYKQNSNKSYRLGYSAMHFIVRLGDEFSGARYDSLKDLTCEIQTRTVLQDAWAVIDHHLMYKQRSLVPEELCRRIDNLSDVLEEADMKFEEIRKERHAYVRKLEKTRSSRTFLAMEINLDSFKAFCERAFPEAPKETEITYFNRVLKWMEPLHYNHLKDLDRAVKKASPILDDVIAELGVVMVERGIEIKSWTNLARVQISLAITNKEFRNTSEASPGFIKILEKYDRIPEKMGKKKG